jgi:hypothetical protein
MDAEGERYRLFEVVAAMLALASRERPTLLIFDDLHWADRPTLLLRRHVMRSARAGSFTIVATYRESELGRTHPLAELLTTLRRAPGVTRLVLALDAILQLKGTDELASQARAASDRIHDALPDELMRRSFADSEVVRRITARR